MMRWDCKDIDRDEIIDELMLEAGLTDAPELTDSLKALESFASLPAPVPGRALAAMLAGSGTEVTADAGAAAATGASAAGVPVDELGKRRQSRKHRPAVIGAAVLAAMGLGIGGVAASNAGFRSGTPDFIQALISGWAPGWSSAPPSLVPPAPINDSPKVTTRPAPADPPTPTVAPAPFVPPAHETAAPSAADPSVDKGVTSAGDSAAAKAPAKQEAKGLPEVPKTGYTEPKTDSQGALKQTTGTLPTLNAKDVQDGLNQVLPDSKDNLAVKSPGSSLRWLLGLVR